MPTGLHQALSPSFSRFLGTSHIWMWQHLSFMCLKRGLLARLQSLFLLLQAPSNLYYRPENLPSPGTRLSFEPHAQPCPRSFSSWNHLFCWLRCRSSPSQRQESSLTSPRKSTLRISTLPQLQMGGAPRFHKGPAMLLWPAGHQHIPEHGPRFSRSDSVLFTTCHPQWHYPS